MSSAPKTIFFSAMLIGIAASSAIAQIPGAPVLQNAWAAPGMVVALDLGGGSAGSGSTFAGAVGWRDMCACQNVDAGILGPRHVEERFIKQSDFRHVFHDRVLAVNDRVVDWSIQRVVHFSMLFCASEQL